MLSDDIEKLLKSDFDDLTERLEKDRFAARILFKLSAKRRMRLGVVALASGLGAAFAASQFMGVVRSLAPSFAPSLPEGAVLGMAAPQIIATLMLGSALIATLLVLRQEV